MTISPQGRHVEQHNHGSGFFVGGHVFGNVEAMDKKTAEALERVATDAPHVAAMLAKALDDGLISPEVARDLAGVSRNINEDVARWIHEGGRGINEDTAHWIREGGRGINEDTAHWLLQAGRSINEDVAHKFSRTADDINSAAKRIERAVGQLSDASAVLRSTRASAQEWDRTAAAMSKSAEALAFASQAHDLDQEESIWSFKNGMIAGFGVALTLAIIVMAVTIYVANR
ncbi:hypothetical protein ACGFIG_11970 [Micromonospora sp. NPDC049048]|uniref:hypothetical protein n=1 Tax=Micromonospora sp. NPDC049048 TaxID=3364263 RepID=UPI003722AD9A